MSAARICSHLRQDGTRCGAIALRHKSLCHFHNRVEDREKRRLQFSSRQAGPVQPRLELPVIEDRASAMLALNDVIQAFALGLIDGVTARTLFAGIRICLSTIKNTALLPDFMEPKPEDDSDSMCQAFLRKLAENKAANISTDLSPVPQIHAVADPTVEGSLSTQCFQIDEVQHQCFQIVADTASQPSATMRLTPPLRTAYY